MREAMQQTGRRRSDSMRLRAFKRYLMTLPPVKEAQTVDYRGFTLEGGKGKGNKWYITSGNDPRIFPSRVAAERAVDICLELRAVRAG